MRLTGLAKITLAIRRTVPAIVVAQNASYLAYACAPQLRTFGCVLTIPVTTQGCK